MDAATASKLEKVARRHASKTKPVPYQRPQRNQQLKPQPSMYQPQPSMYQPQPTMYQPQMLPQQPTMHYYGQQLDPSQQFATTQQFVPDQQFAPGPQSLCPQMNGQFPSLQPQQTMAMLMPHMGRGRPALNKTYSTCTVCKGVGIGEVTRVPLHCSW